MRHTFIANIWLYVLTLASCNESNEITLFARSFAYAINSEDISRVSYMLDPVNHYDWNNVVFNEIDPDSIRILEQDGKIIAKCSESKIFVITKSTKGYIVKSTYSIISPNMTLGHTNKKMDDYHFYKVINSEYPLKITKKENGQEEAILSYQKKIPSLLLNYENSLSNISDLLKSQDYSLNNFFGTTIGIKALIHAIESRDQIKKYKKFLTRDQLSRFEKADKKFQYYYNNQDSI